MKRIMVAMSGGIDSSVAALLLQKQGYEICGATLKLFSSEDVVEEEGGGDPRCSMADVQDARSVCLKLGIEHKVFHFEEEFRRDVIDRFAAGYLDGVTPNPCIDCNRQIKFGRLLQKASLLDYDCIATGHYARVEYEPASGRYLLKKAADPAKDQTYMLYGLTQYELAHTYFPLGGMTKAAARRIAAENGLINASKPDSQDICFVPDGDYAGFLKDGLGLTWPTGDFVDRSGRVLGRHRGLAYYTIGQRRGIGLSFARPKYVVAKDSQNQTVTLGDEEELYSHGVVAGSVNWIAQEQPAGPIQVTVKTRYSQAETPAVLHPGPEDTVIAVFERPQRAITPGQAAVFYDGDIVVGGGTIQRACASGERPRF